MTKASRTQLKFDGHLTVANAEGIRSQLMGAVLGGADVEVDCEGAEKVDLSFVQLVIAARRAAEASGVSLSLRAPASGCLAETLRRGGFLADGPDGSGQRRFWMKEEA